MVEKFDDKDVKKTHFKKQMVLRKKCNILRVFYKNLREHPEQLSQLFVKNVS